MGIGWANYKMSAVACQFHLAVLPAQLGEVLGLSAELSDYLLIALLSQEPQAFALDHQRTGVKVKALGLRKVFGEFLC